MLVESLAFNWRPFLCPRAFGGPHWRRNTRKNGNTTTHFSLSMLAIGLFLMIASSGKARQAWRDAQDVEEPPLCDTRDRRCVLQQGSKGQGRPPNR